MVESTEERELSLVSKLELRIALADSDPKLQSLLHTYLAPLLLKLASEHASVRTKVVALCQHINTRVQSQSIALPAEALLKQFKETNTSLIRHFDLIYIRHALNQMGSASLDLLPSLLHGISHFDGSEAQTSILFNMVLKLLPLIKLPPRGSEEDINIGNKMKLLPEDSTFLARWFGKLLLLTSTTRACPGLSMEEVRFLCRGSSNGETWDPKAPGGLNLIDTKVAALRFLNSGAFNDSNRFIPALIATADPNTRISNVGDDMLKRFRPDLESGEVVEQLFSLYLGSTETGGALPARPALKIKIIHFLSKSVQATSKNQHTIQVLNDALTCDNVGGASGLEVSKMLQQIFHFVTWLTRMGAPSDLSVVAPSIIKALREMVERQGWPVTRQPLKPSELSSRSLAYESIGLLAPKIDASLSGGKENPIDTNLLEWMFTSLGSDTSGPQILVSIEEALGGILNSITKHLDKNSTDQIRPILVRFATSKPGERDTVSGLNIVRSTRFAAVRFSNRCMPYSDIQGRCIDLLAIAEGQDGGLEIAEEGRKGLDPYWYRMLNPCDNITAPVTENKRYIFPRFKELTHYLFSEDLDEEDSLRQKLRSIITSEKYTTVYATAIAYLRNLLLCEALVNTDTIQDIEHNWEQRLDHILSNNENARASVRDYITECDDVLPLLLNACLKGLLFSSGPSIGRSATHFIEIASLTSNKLLSPLIKCSQPLIDTLLKISPPEQDTAAQAFGILISHPSSPQNQRDHAWEILSSHASKWQEAVGTVTYTARGAVLGQAFMLSRVYIRGEQIQELHLKVQQCLSTTLDILKDSRDSTLRKAAYDAIGQLSLSSAIPVDSIQDDQWKLIVEAISADAKKHSEQAIAALGRLSLVISKEDTGSTKLEQLLGILYALHEVKAVEVQFAVGEALSIIAAGWQSTSLISSLDVDVEKPKSGIPSRVLSKILDKIMDDCKAPKPSLKRASVIWLLCLIQYCGQDEEVQTRLWKCQQTFIWLLSDKDETVQESSSRGLSLVYELGSRSLKDDLVRDLVRSFTADSSNMGGGKISEETELFEPGALPTGDGSITTYKDIVGLASEVGDPSLVYRFMSLASNSAIWSSRAAFGRFGLSNVLSDSSENGYLSQNPKLYPKLYRYKFDPNPNVQRSMNDIWNALVKDSNAIIDSHFDAIMDDLLRSIVDGKQWRVRQASCAGIASLLQGRPVEKYDKYLNEILTKSFKVLDDIKSSVRQAALSLCQTLSDIVLRALDTGDSSSKRAKLMLQHIVPFLLGHEGLESSVEEIQKYSIITITKIVKKASGPLLRPFAALILERLLTSLTSVEPQAVNYVHLNADKYGLTGQAIDKMRLTAIRSSPMMESIELHLLDSLDDASMEEVVPALESSLRSAIGLPSKVGCSRVLVILSSKNLLFRPYAARFIRILRKLVLDRNETVSASYSSAIGYLTRLASNEDVVDTIQFAKSLYFESEDAAHRIVAGEIMNGMSKLANDRVQAVAAAFLPFIFLGMHDTTDEVKKFFSKTWNDNVSGPRVISLYLNEILEIVSGQLNSPKWPIKHASALTIAKAVVLVDKNMDIPTATSLWPHLEKALEGKTWDGKDKVLEAFVTFSIHSKAFLEERNDVKERMKAIVIREAKRKNIDYRPHGLRELGRFSRNQEDLDMTKETLVVVSPIFEEMVDEIKSDRMEIDSKDSRVPNIEDKTFTAGIECLYNAANPSIPSAVELCDYLGRMSSIIKPVIEHAGRSVYSTLFDCVKDFFNRVNEHLLSGKEENHTPEPSSLDKGLASTLIKEHEFLFQEIDLPIESVRSKFAHAILSYTKVLKKNSTPLGSSQRRQIEHWRDTERSEAVKTIWHEVSEQLG
ncbi:proteasome component M29 [Microsporum canis]|uniref:Proteasome component ECM29 n=1 Tax=Arthroderma otae (strain ATCC MYA-4605 / CBS 113480) TaxID=554155 RepID=C5FY30_ARTOC|nr:proteasome component ECM29 [Microsporum canis CBS 113480]EEQ34428.1 proteasome component ECM29 [Microsporum canis CBS 113480]